MLTRLASLAVAGVLGIAGALAWLGIGRDPSPSLSPPSERPESPSTADRSLPPEHPPIGNGAELAPEMALPPNHPPIVGGSSQAAMPAPLDEPPALGWRVPADWQDAPNPSPFRLATYRVPGGAEMSVARAGGSTEANIERWLSQFDNAGADTRAERTVRGLRVTVVQVAGTYAPSAMMIAGAAPQTRPRWALEGAIVETQAGAPYFFKLLGPTAAIKAARPSFERLLASLTPR